MAGKGLGITEQITPPVLVFEKAWDVQKMDVVVITTDVPIVEKHVHIYVFDQDMKPTRVKISELKKEQGPGTSVEYLIDVKDNLVVQMIYSFEFLPDEDIVKSE